MKTRKQQLDDIQSEIAYLKSKHSDLDRQFREDSRKKINSIPPEYSYQVFECDGHFDPDGSFRILRTLTNYQVYQDIIAEYGFPTFNGFEAEEEVRSVAYSRNDEGIVTHSGGGYLLLDDPFLCDEDEWIKLKSGYDVALILKRIK